MIEELLPPGAVAAEAFDDPAEAFLYPDEQPAVARAVGKRRREFTTGRLCARRALAGLGVPAGPIPPGPRGAPQWPAGVVGSITHCDGYRAAAVARARDLAALGVDAEPHLPLPDGVVGLVAIAGASPRTGPRTRPRDEPVPGADAESGPRSDSRPDPGPDATSGPEPAMLRELSRTRPGIRWDRVLFSAKESVYKAWFPLTGRWLGFGDAAVVLDPDGGTFTARFLVPGPVLAGRALTGFTGRWLVGNGLIATAVAVPAAPTAQPPS